MTTSPATLADLLLRDPQHPLVREQLLAYYRALCQEERAIVAQRVLLAQVLGIPKKNLDNGRQNRVD